LITGAAGGVGHATAELLASEGAIVALTDVRADALEAAAAAIGGDAFAVPLDLAEPASIAAAVAAAEAKLGPLDDLVNCGAIVIHADPLETAWTDWERIFRINLFGAYETSRLVARSMIDSGARGAIVSVASEAGKKGHIESLAYSASKAALISMTRVLSAALAPYDINVNCVCPGGRGDRHAARRRRRLWQARRTGCGRRLSAAHQFAAGPAHRAGRSRPDDLLPSQ
jgi:NAD(P)-dependent dehydrogenase (short-subunit alcohol dehydrogenase family)